MPNPVTRRRQDQMQERINVAAEKEAARQIQLAVSIALRKVARHKAEEADE